MWLRKKIPPTRQMRLNWTKQDLKPAVTSLGWSWSDAQLTQVSEIFLEKMDRFGSDAAWEFISVMFRKPGLKSKGI